MNRTTKILSATTLVMLVTVLWTAWVVVMLLQPDPFGAPFVRAVVRVGVVLVPAAMYVRLVQERSLGSTFGDRSRWRIGAFVGASVFAIYPGLLIIYRLQTGANWSPETSLAVWLNFLIGSPIAEEILYRGVLYKELRNSRGIISSAMLSAIAFAMLHLPWWILSGEKSPAAVAEGTCSLIVYGLALSYLYETTRSLWAPIAFHCLNNIALRGLS